MRAPLVVSIGMVAVAGLAGAYGLGFFDRPAEVTDEQAGTSAAPVQPAAPAGELSARADEPARPVETAAPAAPAPVTLPVMTTATLRIDSDVPGADVFIDNSFVGKAPAIVEGVQPGRRKISVSAPGYDTVAEFRAIEAGPDELTIPLKVIRLDRRVAVTHRHRLGSCEGTLVATPQGLRYETTRTEDAFRTPLTRIDTLEADYLKRSLKVSARDGRTYDFTVPDAKADELYSFYQDVEKVRQRLVEQGDGDV